MHETLSEYTSYTCWYLLHLSNSSNILLHSKNQNECSELPKVSGFSKQENRKPRWRPVSQAFVLQNISPEKNLGRVSFSLDLLTREDGTPSEKLPGQIQEKILHSCMCLIWSDTTWYQLWVLTFYQWVIIFQNDKLFCDKGSINLDYSWLTVEKMEGNNGTHYLYSDVLKVFHLLMCVLWPFVLTATQRCIPNSQKYVNTSSEWRWFSVMDRNLFVLNETLVHIEYFQKNVSKD